MNQSSIRRTLAALLLYLFGVVIAGALLAPWVAEAGRWLAVSFPSLPWDADTPFRRYFNRALQLAALAGLWPLLRALAVRSWADVGLGRNRDFGKEALIGLTLGIGSVLLATALGLSGERFGLLGKWTMSKRLWTAPVVAAFEEMFFRGVLLGALLRVWRPAPAIAATSVFFSAAHFLKPPAEAPVVELQWWSGLAALPECFRAFADFPKVASSLANLALAGATLGWAYWRTGSLALPLGLHAGWVFAAAGKFTLPWGALPVLAAVFGAVVWITRPSPSRSSADPEP